MAAPEDIGGRFAKQPVVTYQPFQGDLHFALQLTAALPAGPARPRDVAVVIDTTASQAGRSFQNARSSLKSWPTAAKPDDRLNVWAMSTPDMTRSVTDGFQAAQRAQGQRRD